MTPSFAATMPSLDRQFAACVNSGTPDCVKNLTQAIVGDIDVNDRGAGGILETILGVDDTIEKLFEDIEEGVFGTNTEEQKYSIVQFTIRRLLTTIVENFEQLPGPAKDLVGNSVYSWGPQCEVERNNGRGGVCSFLTRNILAVHSFGQLALRTIGLETSVKPKAWQIVATERDAVSRNTLVVQAGLSLNKKAFVSKSRGELCMYRVVCSLDGTGNDCGVPHSMASRAEQELKGELYWIEDLIQGSLNFFMNNVPFGNVTDPEFPSMTDDRGVCQNLVLSSTEPSFDLSLLTNRGVWLRFELPTDGPLDLLQEAEIADAIMESLGLMQGQVQVVDLEIVPSSFEEYTDIQQLYLEFPATLEKQVLEQFEKWAVEDSQLDVLAGARLLEIEIAGRPPRTS